MSIGILGIKVGMTQIFDKNGLVIPVTIIEAGPCVITQVKTLAKEGYNAIQVGYQKISVKLLNKPDKGHLEKVGNLYLKYLKEYKVSSEENFCIGQKITVSSFQLGELVNISGLSIGKGFAGYQKRHHFHRGPMSHGSKTHRLPGSIGAGTTPGRVFLGKRMAGRLGGKKVTIQKLQIIDIKENQNLLVIKGSVPGKKGNLLSIGH